MIKRERRPPATDETSATDEPSDDLRATPDTASGETVNPDEMVSAAIEVAEAGMAVGELPIGAVVVMGDEIVAQSHTRERGAGRRLVHADLLALIAADWRNSPDTPFFRVPTMTGGIRRAQARDQFRRYCATASDYGYQAWARTLADRPDP